LGIPRGISAYQAFFEEQADYYVRTSSEHEIADIVAAISDSFHRWKEPRQSPPRQEVRDWRAILQKRKKSVQEAMMAVERAWASSRTS
jgi:hypothetical protein